MSTSPFHIKPVHVTSRRTSAQNEDESSCIEVSTEPISIEKDLGGKMTMSSKYAAVSFTELAHTLDSKDLETLLQEHGKEDIILSTNILLKLARAEDIVQVDEEEEKKRFWPVPALLGFLAGIAAVILFTGDASMLLLVTVVLASICGALAGFIWQKFYDAKIKGAMEDWAREILSKK